MIDYKINEPIECGVYKETGSRTGSTYYKGMSILQIRSED